MTRALEQLLGTCTVLLLAGDGSRLGSGFFVTQNSVLTAAHTIRHRPGPLVAFQNGRRIGELVVEQTVPESMPVGTAGLPDLAVLRLLEKSPVTVPCVLLDDATPSSEVYAAGYAEGVTTSSSLGGARLEFESLILEAGCTLIKLKGSVLDPGLSGGPLLDLVTGRVVGITKARRNAAGPSGGVAVSVGTLRAAAPHIWEENQRNHSTRREWELARLAGPSLTTAPNAVRDYLEHVRKTVADRPTIVPLGRATASVQQIPSVRVLDPALRAAPPGGKDSAIQKFDHGADHEGVVRWIPLRVKWPSVVLTGVPGAGKSYLLNMHADALAQDGLEQLKNEATSPLDITLPVIADFAVLTRLLPAEVTADAVLAALATAAATSSRTASGRLDDDACRAVAALAISDGRATVCLDGLDEVSERDRRKAAQALGHIVDRGNRLLVTSRPRPQLDDDTAALTGAFRAEVIGFAQGQIYSFARAWFAQTPELSVRFERELRDRHDLQALARVPLLAAFLCKLVASRGSVESLPTTAATLYEHAVLAALGGAWHIEGREAVDAEDPPDPALRLRVLSATVGELAAPWRARPHRFAATEFDRVLTAQPGSDRAARAAERRWAVWATKQPHPPTPPPNFLRWEYLFDGLLTYESAEEARPPVLRFVHPALAEYCTAAHVALLEGDALRAVVDEHRWFDTEWDQVWPLAAALMADPAPLLRAFLANRSDHWFEQTFLASRAAGGAVGHLPHDVETAIGERLEDAVHSPRRVDRDRGVEHIAHLVRSNAEDAAHRARELSRSDVLGQRHRLMLVAALAEVGDEDSLATAAKVLVDPGVPASRRAALAHAVVTAEDPEGMRALTSAIKGAPTSLVLRRLVQAIPLETTAGAQLALDVVHNTAVPHQFRSLIGRALVRLGDAEIVADLKRTALSPVTAWPLRADILAETLRGGDDSLVAISLAVARDPNLSYSSAINLLEALAQRGVIDALTDANRYLTRANADWRERRRLARAVAQMGPPGVVVLSKIVRSSLSLEVKLRPIIALVEVGEELEIARAVVDDRGAPYWVRVRLAGALVSARDATLDVDTLIALVAERDNPTAELVAELIANMVVQGLNSVFDLTVTFVRGQLDESGALTSAGALLLKLLGSAGRSGAAALVRIAQDSTIPGGARALAIVALASSDPAVAGELAARSLQSFDAFVQERLLVLLAERDVIEVLDAIGDVLRDEDERYHAILHLIGGPRATRADIVRGFALATTPRVPPDEASVPRHIDAAEELRVAGVKWQSDAELAQMVDWFTNKLKSKVGARLSTFMTDDQLREFSEAETDEERVEFLGLWASTASTRGTRTLVIEELERLVETIRRNPDDVPRLSTPTSASAMKAIAMTTSVLAEWEAITTRQDRRECAIFLVANADTIATPLGLELLNLARQAHPAVNPYEGLLYLAHRARTLGVEEAQHFILDSDHEHDIFRGLLADGQGERLFLAACAGLLFEHHSASTRFYQAIGAELHGSAYTDAAHAMALSGQLADDGQKADGARTIADSAALFGWTQERVEVLTRALMTGNSSADAEVQTDPPG